VPWVVGVLVVLPALAAGVVPAIAFGKATAGPCPDKVQAVFRFGGLQRGRRAEARFPRCEHPALGARRTSVSTKNGEVVPKATVTAVGCRKP